MPQESASTEIFPALIYSGDRAATEIGGNPEENEEGIKADEACRGDVALLQLEVKILTFLERIQHLCYFRFRNITRNSDLLFNEPSIYVVSGLAILTVTTVERGADEGLTAPTYQVFEPTR